MPTIPSYDYSPRPYNAQPIRNERNLDQNHTKRELAHLAYDINAIARQTLSSLDTAIYNETWDAWTSNYTWIGAWSDHDSRMANMAASDKVNELSYRIQRFNQLLDNYNYGAQNHLHIYRMDDLRHAGHEIMHAELNESHPLYYYAGRIGDYLASSNTKAVLNDVRRKVSCILADSERNMRILENRNY